MRGVRLSDGRVVGGILILLGVFALVEGRRVYALREQMVAGAVVGDDTFPIIVGLGLLLLGGAAAFGRLPSVKVTLPRGPERARMLWGAGLLTGYWLILPYLGYTGSTALVSTGLYRAMGGYRWPLAILLGGLTTGLLFLLFRVWLRQPLPTGWLGL
ncbi:MAG: tripartite tricarboxylate transporter TctB family protein [Candidatus Rokubacteria bacterium]|nr:tripartite tricarboxylate transporter TctB family protein [Candidatus Rokubacteria bacterium]